MHPRSGARHHRSRLPLAEPVALAAPLIEPFAQPVALADRFAEPVALADRVPPAATCAVHLIDDRPCMRGGANRDLTGPARHQRRATALNRVDPELTTGGRER